MDLDDDLDLLSDSDVEDEAADLAGTPFHPNTSRSSLLPQSQPQQRRPSTSGDGQPSSTDEHRDSEDNAEDAVANSSLSAEGHADEPIDEDQSPISPHTRGAITRSSQSGISSEAVPGPKKTRVMVRDAAWSTWWNILYWLYTDVIYFAPLTSSFDHSARPMTGEPKTRRAWIKQWLDEKRYEPDELGPRPVSAKAVYRLADKLDLPALRLRAFQHICGQLTAQNIPAEVFSRFSTTFEDVRKVQIAFFLKHWAEIKKSETMMQIWQQIRVGKHVGFEEGTCGLSPRPPR